MTYEACVAMLISSGFAYTQLTGSLNTRVIIIYLALFGRIPFLCLMGISVSSLPLSPLSFNWARALLKREIALQLAHFYGYFKASPKESN
ncbi:unnamed protein product [Lasius platythorax]|uniref:Uncharacterized protein n=1 Tax=Lasius platythorax TaxID=488582 RepID=A0AAV2PCR2_9HYME